MHLTFLIICMRVEIVMHHLEEEYVPTVCISFHTWKSKRVRLNPCLMDRLWKLGLMVSKPEIYGKYIGPVGKGDFSANSTVANSRVKVVCHAECWTYLGVCWCYFSGVVNQLKLLLEILTLLWNTHSHLPYQFQSNCQSYSSVLTCSIVH